VPLKDDQRAKLEAQIAELSAQKLRVSDSGSDTSEELYAKFGGMYQALTEFYVIQGDNSPGIQLPQFPMMTSLAGAMSGVSDAKAKELVNSYGDAIKKDPSISAKAQAYKSNISTILGNVAFANATINYNLPNSPQVKDIKYTETYYPEYFSPTLFVGVSTADEIRARQVVGSLINDFSLDTGEYISPQILQADLKSRKIIQDSPALGAILMEYTQRYNSKNLPALKK
jgi:hypothetical protein